MSIGEQSIDPNRERFDSNKQSSEDVAVQLEAAMASKNYAEVAKLGEQMNKLKGQEEEFMDIDRAEADAENAERTASAEQAETNPEEDTTPENNEVLGESFAQEEAGIKEQDTKEITTIQQKIGEIQESKEIIKKSPQEILESELSNLRISNKTEEAKIAEDIFEFTGDVTRELRANPMLLQKDYQDANGLFSMAKFASEDETAYRKIYTAIEDLKRRTDVKNKVIASISAVGSGAAGLFGTMGLSTAGYTGLAAIAPWASIAVAAGAGGWYFYKKFKSGKLEKGRHNALSSMKNIFKNDKVA